MIVGLDAAFDGIDQVLGKAEANDAPEEAARGPRRLTVPRTLNGWGDLWWQTVAALVVVWHLGQVLHINTHKAVETPYQRLGADSKALRLETP